MMIEFFALFCDVRTCIGCQTQREKWLCTHNQRRRKVHAQFRVSFVPVSWNEGLEQDSRPYGPKECSADNSSKCNRKQY